MYNLTNTHVLLHPKLRSVSMVSHNEGAWEAEALIGFLILMVLIGP